MLAQGRRGLVAQKEVREAAERRAAARSTSRTRIRGVPLGLTLDGVVVDADPLAPDGHGDYPPAAYEPITDHDLAEALKRVEWSGRSFRHVRVD
ncbi:MAG: hypothetical protein V4850_03835 [Myxococcota bacterium]